MDEFSSFSLTCLPIFVEVEINIPLLFLATKRSYEHQKTNIKQITINLVKKIHIGIFIPYWGLMSSNAFLDLFLHALDCNSSKKIFFLVLSTLISLGEFSPYLKMSFKAEFKICISLLFVYSLWLLKMLLKLLKHVTMFEIVNSNSNKHLNQVYGITYDSS